MGWFGADKMSEEAGQWAAAAMACMVFADGSAREAEIAAARGQVASNPVLKESLGAPEAERLFKEAIDAIAQIPSAMLPSYEIKLQGLAAGIKNINDRNFAFTTVIAVSMSDRTLTASEHQMLQRFHKMLGASIPIPEPGAPAPAEVRALQAPAAGAPAQQQVQQAQQPQQASPQPGPACPTCTRGTQVYPGRGAWCNTCQRWLGAAPAPPSQAQPVVPQAQSPQSQRQVQQPPAQAQVAGPVSAAPLGPCSRCGTQLVVYPGHGPWCSTCRQVVA